MRSYGGIRQIPPFATCSIANAISAFYAPLWRYGFLYGSFAPHCTAQPEHSAPDLWYWLFQLLPAAALRRASQTVQHARQPVHACRYGCRSETKTVARRALAYSAGDVARLPAPAISMLQRFDGACVARHSAADAARCRLSALLPAGVPRSSAAPAICTRWALGDAFVTFVASLAQSSFLGVELPVAKLISAAIVHFPRPLATMRGPRSF